MNNDIDWIVVGRFGRTHGIKGFITVHSYTEPRDNILQYSDWHAFINKQWQPLKLVRLENNGKSILAQVEGYSEREEVARLTNVEIAIRRIELPVLKPGEYYWHELVGMAVFDQKEQNLGKVVDMMPTGANDVIVIEGEKRHLIPYLPGQTVITIDPNERIITVDWDQDF